MYARILTITTIIIIIIFIKQVTDTPNPSIRYAAVTLKLPTQTPPPCTNNHSSKTKSGGAVPDSKHRCE